MQEFKIQAGIFCEVRLIDDNEWTSWTTTKVSRFNEPISRTRTHVVFQAGNWLLKVRTLHVLMFNGSRWIQMK